MFLSNLKRTFRRKKKQDNTIKRNNKYISEELGRRRKIYKNLRKRRIFFI